MTNFQQLFDRIAIDMEDYRRFVPTEADIAGFERDWKFTLPQSYKRFITVFGPGMLANDFLIRAPGCRDSKYDLGYLNSEYQKGFAKRLKKYPEFVPQPDFLRSIVWFCTTFDATSFGWSPSEVTDEKESECAIYLMPRGGDFEPRRILDSFDTFIMNLCLGDQYVPLYRSELDPDTNRDAFSPGRVRGFRIRK